MSGMPRSNIDVDQTSYKVERPGRKARIQPLRSRQRFSILLKHLLLCHIRCEAMLRFWHTINPNHFSSLRVIRKYFISFVNCTATVDMEERPIGSVSRVIDRHPRIRTGKSRQIDIEDSARPLSGW